MNCPSRDTDAGKPKWEFWGRENQELIKAKSQKVIKSCLPIIVIDVSQEIVVLKEAWVILSLWLLFSHSVKFESLWPHGLQHARLPFPSLSPRVYSNSCSSSRWCHPTISSSVVPFSSCLQSFPASGFFSIESVVHIRWPKYWSFSFSISPSNEYSGFISCRIDWFDLLAVQGTLKSVPQHHSSKASVFWHSTFFMVQLSHPYMTPGKTIALTILTFVGKVMSLFFNMLSRFVIILVKEQK